MTAAIAPARRAVPIPSVVAAAVAALGCGALAARPALLASTPRPTLALVVLFGALLVVGAAVPIPSEARSAWRVPRGMPVALATGVVAFGAGRLLVGGYSPARVTLPVLVANTLAAVAEEVWFRRLCFGLLAPAGPAVAVAGSAVLFAAVHVASYGLWVLPLDLAAGALLGWQRAVTGSWAAPAATHVIANLLVLL
jgi:hypothetical protein